MSEGDVVTVTKKGQVMLKLRSVPVRLIALLLYGEDGKNAQNRICAHISKQIENFWLGNSYSRLAIGGKSWDFHEQKSQLLGSQPQLSCLKLLSVKSVAQNAT